MVKRILSVDDSVSMRQMVAFTLGQAGYVVEEAADGAQGLERARRSGFDLVLTDQNMPGLDGLALVRELRKLPGYAQTPILVLTTESGDDIKQRGRAVGASGWLVKPFDPQHLCDIVRKVLQ